jgi:hypothetical protein
VAGGLAGPTRWAGWWDVSREGKVGRSGYLGCGAEQAV